MSVEGEQLDRARDLVRSARRAVALTGAGVSTDSGIPDFRGPNGVWTTNPGAERLYTLQNYVADAEVRRQSWQTRLRHPGWHARPNAAHRALAALEQAGTLAAIITQNIDGLHQQAGSERVIEVHGTMFHTRCLSCDDVRDMREALDRVSAGEADPPCLLCGGILKSATISFGQSLDAEVLRRAQEHARSCDVMLAAGSSLTVQPAAGLVGVAARAGADVVICNGAETPYDGIASAVVRGPLAETLPTLVAPAP